MFVKENKFEVTGMGDLVKPKVVASKKVETKEILLPGSTPVEAPAASPAKEEGSMLSFDLNVNGN
jgi:hypothetical protein